MPGTVDATKAQQQEELNEILRKARTNPWHLFKSGLLRRVDVTGMRKETPYGDPLVRITPFHSRSLPSNLKKLLGDEFTWASWLQHRFQDTVCTSCSRHSSSASSLGTTLSSSSASQRFTPMAIVRHMRSTSSVFLAASRPCSMHSQGAADGVQAPRS